MAHSGNTFHYNMRICPHGKPTLFIKLGIFKIRWKLMFFGKPSECVNVNRWRQVNLRISNHRQFDGMFKILLQLTLKETSKTRIAGRCGCSPTVANGLKGPVLRKRFSMLCHHAIAMTKEYENKYPYWEVCVCTSAVYPKKIKRLMFLCFVGFCYVWVNKYWTNI